MTNTQTDIQRHKQTECAMDLEFFLYFTDHLQCCRGNVDTVHSAQAEFPGGIVEAFHWKN